MYNLRDIVELMRSGRWAEAHDRIQRDASPLGAWLHGLLHLQEGDLEDAENWYDRAGRNFRGRGRLDEELELFMAALRDASASASASTPPYSIRSDF